jgi:hypothetical protein
MSDINSVRDLPGSPRGGDILPPCNPPGVTTTPASGSTVRDDGPSQRAGADTAATWTRSTPIVNDNPGGLSGK